jgi:Spy/CpxP family protein refolding chaperone
MKTLSAALTLLIGLALCPKVTTADEPATERGERIRERLAATMADLDLTDEQETKIADIRKENRPKIREAARELAAVVKEEMEDIRGDLTAEQKEKLGELKEERKGRRIEGLAARLAHLRDLDLTDSEVAQIDEIREECRPKIKNCMKELSDVLTEDQKEARKKALEAGESRREVRESLNLTETQKEKVEAIGKELRTCVRQELDKMRAVLSPEQREKLGEFRQERRERVRDRLAFAIGERGELNLTPEQRTKIAQIRQEFRPKVHEAGNKLRAAVRAEISQILDVIRD